MSDGTAYSTKQQLIDSITSRIYTNIANEVSADDEQTAMLNIVESIYNYIETNLDHNLTTNKNVGTQHDIGTIGDTSLDLITNATTSDVVVIRRVAGWVKQSIGDLFDYYNDLPQTLTNKVINALDNTITGLDSSDISDFNTSVSSNSAVALNTAHSTGTGSDHSDVVANSAYRALGHVPLSYMAANNGVATLDAGGKIPNSQLPSFMTYKGTWDPLTNIPTLTDGIGTNGDVYKASNDGTYDFGSGNITFVEGDWVIYNGTIWEKSTNSDQVVSVNGQQGIVLLDLEDIPETASTKYFTSTNQANLGTLSAGSASDADALHTHPLKADKIVTPTAIQQLELQTIDSNGQYIGSGICKINTVDELKVFFASDDFLTGILTTSLTLSTDTYDLGIGTKRIIGESYVLSISGIITFNQTGASSTTLMFEPHVWFRASSSEFIFNSSLDVTLYAKYISHDLQLNMKLTQLSTATTILYYSNLLCDVTLTGTAVYSIYSDLLYQNNSNIFNRILDVNLLNSEYKFINCTETGRTYKYVTSGSAYTVDNDYVLATADGGDTRFVSLDYDEVTNNILTITDVNVATYIGTGSGSTLQYLINVPISTKIISFETTAYQKIYGIQFSSTVANGKRVSLVGNVEYACSGAETATGRFSSYLYGYLGGGAGTSEYKALDAFIEFMAWNGYMYSDGY